MDQFCGLKNDDYRRCACSDRVYQMIDARDALTSAGEKLTVFTENLDVVGMTAAQATAMKTASDGENALTADTSSSKALLQAIMNSIRGNDSNVAGKYSDLNSINLSFDMTGAFGNLDATQAISTYNGKNLYTAVYPQCRDAVRADCNDASLQRAITAYLMAIEQDCNTVATAITKKQKELKSALREGSAMLDLARVENRQKHNSDDIATCIANVQSSVLSEEVCGAGYKKCLDNGEFIDVSTGAPIAGVANFYELGKILAFQPGVDAANQQLANIAANRTFVQNFEKRVKKFAQPALDKCTENADLVWSEYLNRAMLDIYYAQQSKVDEIKQGCFDFVSACYMNGDESITAAMKGLIGDDAVLLQPYKLALSDKLCDDYVASCNNMFANGGDNDNIVKQYIENRTETDTLTACRAVVKQCFDKFGGVRYENFYYPFSGLFKKKFAPDWFTLYEYSAGGDLLIDTINGKEIRGNYKSECAIELTKIDACNTQKMIENAFGGFDIYPAEFADATNQINQIWTFNEGASDKIYGVIGGTKDDKIIIQNRYLRSTGVATETYNQIIDILTTQCTNVQGRFVATQQMLRVTYDQNDYCVSHFGNSSTNTDKIYNMLVAPYGIADGENMCPRDYGLTVDTQSWGACLCWENGGRRSKNGKSAKCIAAIPVDNPAKESACSAGTPATSGNVDNPDNWCTLTTINNKYQACLPDGCTVNGTDLSDTNMPEGLKN